MPTLTRPGVYIDTSSFPTYVSASPGTAAAAFVGWCPRGPFNQATLSPQPVAVSSWKQFTQYFGGFETAYPPSQLHLAVFTYFAGGGSSATIIRAVRLDSSGPVISQASLDDTGTTPQPTLLVQAANPGMWGNNLFIDVLPGTLTDSSGNLLSFTLVVKYQGSGPSNVVETWSNVSMVPGSTVYGQSNYAPSIINSQYSGSNFITVTDLLSSNAVPSNNPSPTSASVNLSGGSDGSSITFQDQLAAVQALDQFPDQPFVLNLPGLSNANDVGSVVGYAQDRGDVFVVIDCPPGLTPGAMVQFAQGLASSPQAAIYYPQVQISDPYSSIQGVTRLIPPGGYVVGQYISTDANRGVAKAPAGLGASLQGAYGLETVLTNNDQGNLTQANVNCIVSIPGAGVVIWGARTLSPYLVTRYVPVERTLIYLETEFVALTKFAVFEPNYWVLWNQITSVLNQFLNSFWQSGGLQGNVATDAYYVTCDETNNTPATIQQGVVNIEVGVALQDPAEFVVISIGQWAGGSSTSVST
jgi:uncharacterized protein